MTAPTRRQTHDAMVRFADGDRSASHEVFRGLWPIVLAFVHGMGLLGADADDAAQRALLKVFAQIADLDPGRDGVTWAVGIAAYEVLTVRKQAARRREVPSEAAVDVASNGLAPDERMLADELTDALHSAIGELEDRDRAALAEILDEVGPASGETARKRRYRAVERLRAVWRRVHG